MKDTTVSLAVLPRDPTYISTAEDVQLLQRVSQSREEETERVGQTLEIVRNIQKCTDATHTYRAQMDQQADTLEAKSSPARKGGPRTRGLPREEGAAFEPWETKEFHEPPMASNDEST